jgi:uncharacterized protein
MRRQPAEEESVFEPEAPPEAADDEATTQDRAAPPAAAMATDRVTLRGDEGTSTWVHFLGSRSRPLFAALHLPAGPALGATLICPPIGAELARNYRREVLLGRALARRGIAALRFQYWGTGHSGGDSSDLGFDGMCADAEVAIEHLRATVGVLPVGIVGTRLGAVVATVTAARSAPFAIALWDPVIAPERYFREVFRARLMTDLKHGGAGPSNSRTLVEELDRVGVVEVAGYPITAALHHEAMAQPLPQLLEIGRCPVLLLEMERQGRLSRSADALQKQLAAAGRSVTTKVVEHTGSWWFGASARDGAADAQTTAEAAITVTVDFLAEHLTAAMVDA